VGQPKPTVYDDLAVPRDSRWVSSDEGTSYCKFVCLQFNTVAKSRRKKYTSTEAPKTLLLEAAHRHVCVWFSALLVAGSVELRYRGW
jgi:hypothetical protein